MFDLKSITTGIVEKPPRLIVLGVEKIGKSSFAAGAPNPVILPIRGEEGVDALDCAKFPVADSYDDVVEAVKTLCTEEHDFKTFVIDSTSTLESIVWESVCKESDVKTIEEACGGYGKGFGAAVIKWQYLLQGLDALREQGMTIILIGHVKTTTFNDPLTESYTKYAWDINMKAAACMQRWADATLFCNIRVTTKEQDSGFNKTDIRAKAVGGRYLFTQSSPSYPAGGRGRYGQLPEKVELNWQAYMAALDAVE